ncbi:MAG: ribosome small subunit-dependent GTPase A [Candidatus Hydrogenedentes bacterium]|nr:ribosome small subunit-dependent GTPase A [Candidatus Hydrogenedentota bacterium]
MVKRKRPGKKKRSTVRERDWEQNWKAAFSHDLSRHRRALAKLPEHSAYAGALPGEFVPNATVVSHSRKWAFVETDSGWSESGGGTADTTMCLIDERLREGEESLLAPGDRVLVEVAEGKPTVRAVAPRLTRLARCAGKHDRLKQQVIAANVDILVIVAAAACPPFRPGLVDRFLITAQQGGVTPLLCLNKIDLVEHEPPEMEFYRELDLDICIASCETGEGIEVLRQKLAGKTSVLAGHSGVGKSSLLNRLDPNLRVVTRELSETTKRGRHTTTTSVLYELQEGIRIIDTPGIRALEVWNVSPEEVAFYFPEIAACGMRCKFRNCTHIHETECAVKQAVADGEVSKPRYESYKRLRTGMELEGGRT